MSEFTPGQYQPQSHMSFMNQMRGDDSERGGISRRAAVVGGVATGIVALGFGGALWLKGQLPGFPDQTAAPEDSEISVETLAIEPVNFECRSTTLFDVSDSKVRTKYELSDRIKIAGYGSVMEEGVIKLDTCAEGTGIETEVREIDGKKVKVVKVRRDSMIFNASFVDSQTLVVPSNPPETKILGGAIDLLSGGAELGCKGFNRLPIGTDVDCDKIRVISSWKETDQGELQRALRVNVLEKAQQQCAPTEWRSQYLATRDSYKQQAVDKGLPHESVELEIVDEDGKPTTETPDYTKSTVQQLKDKGVLTKESEGSPIVEFESVTCAPLEGGYQPKFDDGGKNAPQLPDPSGL